MFYGRKISKVFDLKGSLRGRFAKLLKNNKADKCNQTNDSSQNSGQRGDESKQSKIPNKVHKYSSDTETSSEDEAGSDQDNDSYGSSDASSEEEDKAQGKEKKKESISSNEVTDNSVKEQTVSTMLDGDFLEFTSGRPLPLNDRAKAVFHMSILNVSFCNGYDSILS